MPASSAWARPPAGDSYLQDVLGLLTTASAVAGFAVIDPAAGYRAVVPVMLLLGAGGTAVMVTGSGAATLGAGPDSGVASALVNSGQQEGAALGIALLTAIAAGGHDAADRWRRRVRGRRGHPPRIRRVRCPRSRPHRSGRARNTPAGGSAAWARQRSISTMRSGRSEHRQYRLREPLAVISEDRVANERMASRPPPGVLKCNSKGKGQV